jgi:hypothetical protein
VRGVLAVLGSVFKLGQSLQLVPLIKYSEQVSTAHSLIETEAHESHLLVVPFHLNLCKQAQTPSNVVAGVRAESWLATKEQSPQLSF